MFEGELGADGKPKLAGVEEWRAHAEAYEASDGREGALRNGHPVVVITTIGAKSGTSRKTPVIKLRHGERYAIVASLGGSEKNPNWYWNVLAHPIVTLQDGAVRRSYRARLVEGADREVWWERVTRTFPLYSEYQTKTARIIPVFVLEPAESRLVPEGVDPVEAMLAIEEIKQLKAKYFRFVDKKKWANLEALFTPECTFVFESTLPGVAATQYASASEFASAVAIRQADTIAMHHGHTPEITLIDAERAAGIWVLEDVVQRPPGGIPSFRGWGHYYEHYKRVDGVWKISATRLERHRELLIADLPEAP
jgi:deazaflavin-dependent oxidoreductase (nitroreductase family)